MMKIKSLVFLVISTLSIFTAKAQEENKPEPEFTGYYFLNSKNQKVTKVTSSEKYVFLVIETVNAFGEWVTLSLDEDDGNYIYKNKYLNTKNGIRFKIRKNEQKVKLIVFKEGNKKHQRLKKEAE